MPTLDVGGCAWAVNYGSPARHHVTAMFICNNQFLFYDNAPTCVRALWASRCEREPGCETESVMNEVQRSKNEDLRIVLESKKEFT